MAQTTLKFAVRDTANVPSAGENAGGGGSNSSNAGGNTSNAASNGTIQKTSSTSEVTKASSTDTSTTNDGYIKSANTGFLSQETSAIFSDGTSPFVFGGVFLVGIILLFAFVAKMKKRNKLSFQKSMNQSRHATTVLGLLSFLMIFAGLGGVASKFIGSSASAAELSDISTKIEVDAVPKGAAGSDYQLYCATDYITPNGVSDYGYQLYMYADGGELPASTFGLTNITSAEGWDGLGLGQWGYYLGEYSENATFNPLPQNIGVLDNKNGATTADSIPVTFCAKISSGLKDVEYSTTINYVVLPKTSEDDYIEIDYYSVDDNDEDGIVNREENRLGLDPTSNDTDNDGLTDNEEIEIGTNPLSKDTDGDGLTDYSEVEIALAEEGQIANGVSIDATIPHTYTGVVSDNISFTITGKGNIPLSTVEVTDPEDIAEALEVAADSTDPEADQKAIDDIRDLPGKAYIFNRVGEEITEAYITASTVDLSTEGGSTDCEDECVGLAGSNEVYGTKLTPDEEDIVDTVTITKVEENGNTYIRIPVTDAFSITFAGDSTLIDDDDELVGNPLISPDIFLLPLALGGIVINSPQIMSDVIAGIKSFFSKKPSERELTPEQKDELVDSSITIINGLGAIVRDFNHACRETGIEVYGEYDMNCARYLLRSFAEFLKQFNGTTISENQMQSMENDINRKVSASTTTSKATKNSVADSIKLDLAKSMNAEKNKNTVSYYLVDRTNKLATKSYTKSLTSFKNVKSITGVGPTAFINTIKNQIKNRGVAFVVLKLNAKSGFGVTSISSGTTKLGITSYKLTGYNMNNKNKSETWTITCGASYCKYGLSDLMVRTN